MFLARAAFAGDALLTWSPVAGAAGYRIYARVGSTAYGAGTDVGLPALSTDGLIRQASSALVAGQLNSFIVSAYDANGVEGDHSNEISVAAPANPTATFTATRTFTPPPTATRTFTFTSNPTATRTPTFTATRTPTFTATATRTPTRTPTPTPTLKKRRVGGRIRDYSSGQPMAFVQVAVQGTAVSASVATDTAGEYAYDAPDGQSVRIEPRHAEPVLGRVNSLDAAYVLQSVLGMRVLSAEQRLACDVSGNGSLSSLDAALILRHRVGAIAELPVERSCDSEWAFLPAALPLSNQSTLPPTTANECQMGSIVIDPLIAAVADRDFVALHFGDCTQEPTQGAALVREGETAEPRARATWAQRDVRGRATLVLELENLDPVHAIDAQLAFDGTRIRARRVRFPTHQRHTLVTLQNGDVPGMAAFSVASARPLAADRTGKLSLEVLFDELQRQPGAVLWYLLVNGRPIPVTDAS